MRRVTPRCMASDPPLAQPPHLPATGIGPGSEEKLIGWGGETYDPDSKPAAAQLTGDGEGPRWIETISWSPRAYVYHSFLTHAEVDHMIGLVEQKVGGSATRQMPAQLVPASCCARQPQAPGVRPATRAAPRPAPQVARSAVVDTKTGASKLDPIRTSYGAGIM